jgi:large subunit ribosomal protein L10
VDRTEKEAFIQSLNGALDKAGVVVVTQYSGLNVAAITRLRSQMRKAGVTFRVIKNRLTKRALEGTPYAGIADLFIGPTAIAFSDDVVAPAKIAVDFAKEDDHLVVIGGAMGEKRLDAAAVKALAALPSLDGLRAQLVGLLQAPAQKVAMVLAAPAGQLARITGAYAAKEQA